MSVGPNTTTTTTTTSTMMSGNRTKTHAPVTEEKSHASSQDDNLVERLEHLTPGYAHPHDPNEKALAEIDDAENPNVYHKVRVLGS
jgi:hypothetical protein